MMSGRLPSGPSAQDSDTAEDAKPGHRRNLSRGEQGSVTSKVVRQSLCHLYSIYQMHGTSHTAACIMLHSIVQSCKWGEPSM